jgi:hypothetical protein
MRHNETMIRAYLETASGKRLNGQTFIEWEGSVIDQIEIDLECTRSDAQGVKDAQEDLLFSCWQAGMKPEKAAALIIKAGANEDIDLNDYL